ncbi:hypothetical protein WJX77_004716 [Trebouxia sp. C0004]
MLKTSSPRQGTCKVSALDPQAAYKDLIRIGSPRSVPILQDTEGVPLLDLPDGVLEEIAGLLPASCLATLQVTCHHLNILLKQNRFWHNALKKHDPVWVSSGVCPLSTRHGIRTWKELVAMSIRLQQAGIGGDVLASPQAVCFRGLNLWNAGKAREELKFQLDYHLVHTEYKSSMWHQLLGQHYFRAENIADLMELIYFLWFEARQLTRAANMLSKVLSLLAEDRASAAPEVAEDRLGYSTIQLAIPAASAGAYLIDLLHMRSLKFSPMSAADPDDFLKACQGYSPSGEATVIEAADCFEWCGGSYSRTDLRGAFSVLCTTQRSERPDFSQNVPLPDQTSSREQDGQQHDDRSVNEPSSWNAPQGQAGSSPDAVLCQNLPASPMALGHSDSPLQSSVTQDEGQDQDQAWGEPDQQISLAEQYKDPWLPSSWGLLGGAAQALLNGLAEAEVIPWEVLKAWGSVLKRKVARISTTSRETCLAPSDACRGYALYAANSLLHRLHGGPESSMVYAQTGRMYDSAKQYCRAAHYYKLHIMANFGSGYLPSDNDDYSALICLAGAYDWDSVSTGSLHSYQQAFAWQRALVRSLVTNADKPQLLSKQSYILGDMLSSHSPRHAPHLHVNSRLVLAVGAYQTSMRSTPDGLAVVAWLQQSLEMLAVAEQAFLAFLKDAQEAFNIMSNHAARRKAVKDQEDNDSLACWQGGYSQELDHKMVHGHERKSQAAINKSTAKELAETSKNQGCCRMPPTPLPVPPFEWVQGCMQGLAGLQPRWPAVHGSP